MWYDRNEMWCDGTEWFPSNEVLLFASKIEFSPHHSINITDTSHTMLFIGGWEYYINLLLFYWNKRPMTRDQVQKKWHEGTEM